MNREYIITNLDSDGIKTLIGINDANLKLLENLYNVDLAYHDDKIIFMSDNDGLFECFEKHMDHIVNSINKYGTVDYDYIKQSFLAITENNMNIDWQSTIIGYTSSGKPLRCKTFNQYRFINEIKHNDLLFSIGPAGTGKTFLAVLLAYNALKNNDVNKIILTRPAVEAGESLGFLPGDLKEKVDPYLMPLYDSLEILMGKETMDRYIEKGIIEVIPLAYMRGRTLNDAFVILDEAQNTTASQMLMFLTRLGYNSKMIVNGDITQIDLNIYKTQSGLVMALDKLVGIKDISFVEFSNSDVVRNPLVQTIIENFKI